MAYDIRLIKNSDIEFPPLLKEIPQAPKQLYLRGNGEILTAPHLLAVVGSRKAGRYGAQCVSRLLTKPVRAGIVVVSGLAYGVDSLAHQVAVAEGKPTIAVLGSGIDDGSIYPHAHKKLAHEILDNGGTIISEYEPGTSPLPGYFPARNRIIAGLSQVTLVVQASLKSGSLITSRLAMETNREVAAVPGPITDALSVGPNMLIRDGAHVIIEPEDLLLLFGIDEKNQTNFVPHTIPAGQQELYILLSNQPRHVDELIATLKKPAPEITTMLMQLELSGLAQHVGGMKYVKK